MSTSTRFIRVGRFELDREDGGLRHDGRPFDLAPLLHAIFTVLMERAGRIVSRQTLVDLAWNGREISEDALNKAVDRLRAALDRADPDGPVKIAAVRRGFRLEGPVGLDDPPPASERRPQVVPPAPESLAGVDVRVLLAEDITLVTQRRALESLSAPDVAAARAAFATLVDGSDVSVPGLIGLANALVLEFESTRADEYPDHALLDEAYGYIIAAMPLAPESPELWSALATILHHRNQPTEAVAAATKAVRFETGPGLIHQHLRLSYVAPGGNERLKAANYVLKYASQNPLARWFAGTVYASRNLLDDALNEASIGCEVQDDQRRAQGPAGPLAIGMHLLRGQILAAMGRQFAARDAYESELSSHTSHLLAREVRAATHYALGALDMEDARFSAAGERFRQTLALVPGHGPAREALLFVEEEDSPLLAGRSEQEGLDGLDTRRPIDGDLVDGDIRQDAIAAAIPKVIALVLRERDQEAADFMLRVLQSFATLGPGAAWVLPIEPILYRWFNSRACAALRKFLFQLAS